MEKLNNFFEDNSKKFKFGFGIGVAIGIIMCLYGVVAAIWGFAPIHNFNGKIIGSGLVLGVVSIILWGIFDDNF